MAEVQTRLTPVGCNQGHWYHSLSGFQVQGMANRLGRGPSFFVYFHHAEQKRGDAFDGPEGPHWHSQKGPSRHFACQDGEDALTATIREVYDAGNFAEGLPEGTVVTAQLCAELAQHTRMLCTMGV